MPAGLAYESGSCASALQITAFPRRTSRLQPYGLQKPNGLANESGSCASALQITMTNEQLHWLTQHGHTVLASLQLISLRPLKVDWSNSRLAHWQQTLLEEQLQFRQRAAGRFPDAERWLWTDRSLQQASDWQSAMAKAALFPAGCPVIDACCGAGADLVALSAGHPVLAIDRDRAMLELARANMRAHGQAADYLQAELPGALAQLSDVCLHADPDRRRGQERDTRTTHAAAFSPPLTDIVQMGQHARACIIKLAPATEIEAMDDQEWRRAWLGSGRECPQQLLMRGDLSWNIEAGHHGAMLVEHPELAYSALANATCDSADEPDRFVVEPHAALYASGLAAAWADQHNLLALPHAGSYFTGDEIFATPWSQVFEVVEHMSWDERRVRKWLKANHVGTVEVKTRQVPLDANQLQRQLTQPSGQPMTILLYRRSKSIRAIMAKRIQN